MAEDNGIIEYADAKKIVVKYDVDPDSFEANNKFDDDRKS
jgi:hypothetical protein